MNTIFFFHCIIAYLVISISHSPSKHFENGLSLRSAPSLIRIPSTYVALRSKFPPATFFLMHLNAISFFKLFTLRETRHSVSRVSNLRSSFPREGMTRIKDTTCGSSPFVFACSPIFFTQQRRKMFSGFYRQPPLSPLSVLSLITPCLPFFLALTHPRLHPFSFSRPTAECRSTQNSLVVPGDKE